MYLSGSCSATCSGTAGGSIGSNCAGSCFGNKGPAVRPHKMLPVRWEPFDNLHSG
ncbi:hypothetical protein HanIR_Chr06g0271091 [Helianthus annuus]|nr:hypothetical protein HanIR_Chr06g0271091 [Helianthus annuus]